MLQFVNESLSDLSDNGKEEKERKNNSEIIGCEDKNDLKTHGNIKIIRSQNKVIKWL